MDSSSRSAAESASEVSAALVPRTAEMSADIYQLIVREIPQLHSDKRVLELLEASVAENVATVLHILQHGIDLEKVHAPSNVSRIPSGSQAHALDSSRGRKRRSPEQAAFPATWLMAC